MTYTFNHADSKKYRLNYMAFIVTKKFPGLSAVALAQVGAIKTI